MDQGVPEVRVTSPRVARGPNDKCGPPPTISCPPEHPLATLLRRPSLARAVLRTFLTNAKTALAPTFYPSPRSLAGNEPSCVKNGWDLHHFERVENSTRAILLVPFRWRSRAALGLDAATLAMRGAWMLARRSTEREQGPDSSRRGPVCGYAVIVASPRRNLVIAMQDGSQRAHEYNRHFLLAQEKRNQVLAVGGREIRRRHLRGRGVRLDLWQDAGRVARARHPAIGPHRARARATCWAMRSPGISRPS